jgi:arylsulfatase A-like enzyme
VEAAGRGGRTLFVAVGDHGESLGERGVWFNHGEDLSEAATRVPLVLSLPGAIPQGATVEEPVELGDIAPTIRALVGLTTDPSLALPPIGQAHRRGLARQICLDRAANQRARAAGQIDAPRYRLAALRSLRGRLVWPEAPGSGPAWYETSSDPSEARASDLPPELGGLQQMAEDLLLASTVGQGGEEELDPATRARLQALGYLEP